MPKGFIKDIARTQFLIMGVVLMIAFFIAKTDEWWRFLLLGGGVALLSVYDSMLDPMAKRVIKLNYPIYGTAGEDMKAGDTMKVDANGYWRVNPKAPKWGPDDIVKFKSFDPNEYKRE
jgi:hypothetical protein